MPIYSTDQLFLAKDYKNLVVVYRNGAPVRLSDLGRVVDGNEDIRNYALVNDKPMVQISINRQPGANVVETVDRVKAILPQLQASIPAAINALFGAGTTTGPSNPGGGTNPPPVTGTVADLLARAQAQFDAASAALKQGDLVAYAKAIKAAQDDVAAAVTALTKAGTTTSTTVPGSTPTTSAGATTTVPGATTTTTLPPA